MMFSCQCAMYDPMISVSSAVRTHAAAAVVGGRPGALGEIHPFGLQVPSEKVGLGWVWRVQSYLLRRYLEA